MSNRKKGRRPQVPKPRMPRPRSVVFTDRFHDADKKAARGTWLDADLQEEIDNWKEWL